MADGLATVAATRESRNHEANPGFIGSGAEIPNVKVRGSSYFKSEMSLEHHTDTFMEPRTTGRKAFHGSSLMAEVMSTPNTSAGGMSRTLPRGRTPGVFDGDEQDPFLSTTALVELSKSKSGVTEGAAKAFKPVDTIPIKMYTKKRSKSGRHVDVEDMTWGTASGDAFMSVGGVPKAVTREGARPGPRSDPITGDGPPDGPLSTRRRAVAWGNRATATMSSLAFVEPDKATSYGHKKWLKGTGYPMRPAPYDGGDEGANWESAKQEMDRRGMDQKSHMLSTGQLTGRVHVVRTGSNVVLGGDRAKTISLMKDSFPALTRAHVEARAREQIKINRLKEFKRADNIRRLE